MWSLIVELWNTVVFEPIFNLITVLISVLPGHNFGVALIVFTILMRLALYPVIKKQILQLKKQKELQPEVLKIKKANRGNRQREALETMALYKEHKFNPFAVLGYLLIQIPIFIGLYQVINAVATNSQSMADNTEDSRIYGFVQKLPWLEDLREDPEVFDATFLGLVDLTRPASDNPGLTYVSVQPGDEDGAPSEPVRAAGLGTGYDLSLDYRPAAEGGVATVAARNMEGLEYAILAEGDECGKSAEFQRLDGEEVEISQADLDAGRTICARADGRQVFYTAAFVIVTAAAVTQYFLTTQLAASRAKGGEQKTLRQIFKDQSEGKEVDQSEVSAAMNNLTAYIFPALIFLLSIGWFSALPFYWTVNGLIQFFQQKLVSDRDDKGVKATVGGKETPAALEKPLNAKQKKQQAAGGARPSRPGRNAKRVRATAKTVKKKEKKG